MAVTDEDIGHAMRLLAREGICVEPSSAASVAAVAVLQRQQRFRPDDDVVCLLTGAGVKWPDALLGAMEPHEAVDEDVEAVRSWISGFDQT